MRTSREVGIPVSSLLIDIRLVSARLTEGFASVAGDVKEDVASSV